MDAAEAIRGVYDQLIQLFEKSKEIKNMDLEDLSQNVKEILNKHEKATYENEPFWSKLFSLLEWNEQTQSLSSKPIFSVVVEKLKDWIASGYEEFASPASKPSPKLAQKRKKPSKAISISPQSSVEVNPPTTPCKKQDELDEEELDLNFSDEEEEKDLNSSMSSEDAFQDEQHKREEDEMEEEEEDERILNGKASPPRNLEQLSLEEDTTAEDTLEFNNWIKKAYPYVLKQINMTTGSNLRKSQQKFAQQTVIHYNQGQHTEGFAKLVTGAGKTLCKMLNAVGLYKVRSSVDSNGNIVLPTSSVELYETFEKKNRDLIIMPLTAAKDNLSNTFAPTCPESSTDWCKVLGIPVSLVKELLPHILVIEKPTELTPSLLKGKWICLCMIQGLSRQFQLQTTIIRKWATLFNNIIIDEGDFGMIGDVESVNSGKWKQMIDALKKYQLHIQYLSGTDKLATGATMPSPYILVSYADGLKEQFLKKLHPCVFEAKKFKFQDKEIDAMDIISNNISRDDLINDVAIQKQFIKYALEDFQVQKKESGIPWIMQVICPSVGSEGEKIKEWKVLIDTVIKENCIKCPFSGELLTTCSIYGCMSESDRIKVAADIQQFKYDIILNSKALNRSFDLPLLAGTLNLKKFGKGSVSEYFQGAIGRIIRVLNWSKLIDKKTSESRHKYILNENQIPKPEAQKCFVYESFLYLDNLEKFYTFAKECNWTKNDTTLTRVEAEVRDSLYEAAASGCAPANTTCLNPELLVQNMVSTFAKKYCNNSYPLDSLYNLIPIKYPNEYTVFFNQTNVVLTEEVFKQHLENICKNREFAELFELSVNSRNFYRSTICYRDSTKTSSATVETPTNGNTRPQPPSTPLNLPIEEEIDPPSEASTLSQNETMIPSSEVPSVNEISEKESVRGTSASQNKKNTMDENDEDFEVDNLEEDDETQPTSSSRANTKNRLILPSTIKAMLQDIVNFFKDGFLNNDTISHEVSTILQKIPVNITKNEKSWIQLLQCLQRNTYNTSTHKFQKLDLTMLRNMISKLRELKRIHFPNAAMSPKLDHFSFGLDQQSKVHIKQVNADVRRRQKCHLCSEPTYFDEDVTRVIHYKVSHGRDVIQNKEFSMFCLNAYTLIKEEKEYNFKLHNDLYRQLVEKYGIIGDGDMHYFDQYRELFRQVEVADITSFLMNYKCATMNNAKDWKLSRLVDILHDKGCTKVNIAFRKHGDMCVTSTQGAKKRFERSTPKANPHSTWISIPNTFEHNIFHGDWKKSSKCIVKGDGFLDVGILSVDVQNETHYHVAEPYRSWFAFEKHNGVTQYGVPVNFARTMDAPPLIVFIRVLVNKLIDPTPEIPHIAVAAFLPSDHKKTKRRKSKSPSASSTKPSPSSAENNIKSSNNEEEEKNQTLLEQAIAESIAEHKSMREAEQNTPKRQRMNDNTHKNVTVPIDLEDIDESDDE